MGIAPTIWWLAIFWGIWWSDIIIIWQTTWYGFGGLDPRNCCFDVWKNDERDLGVQSFRTNPYDRCTFVFHDDQRLASCGLFYTKVRLGYKLLTSPIRFILRVPTNSGHSGHSTWRDWSKLIQRHVKDMNKFMEIWNIYEYLQIPILNSFAWLGIDGIWTILGIIKDY